MSHTSGGIFSSTGEKIGSSEGSFIVTDTPSGQVLVPFAEAPKTSGGGGTSTSSGGFRRSVVAVSPTETQTISRVTGGRGGGGTIASQIRLDTSRRGSGQVEQLGGVTFTAQEAARLGIQREEALMSRVPTLAEQERVRSVSLTAQLFAAQGFGTKEEIERNILGQTVFVPQADVAKIGKPGKIGVSRTLSVIGEKIKFADTLGGRLDLGKIAEERGGRLATGDLPLVPSPGAAAGVFRTTRVAFGAVSQRVGKGKVITEQAFKIQRPFFPFFTTQKGVAVTETIFAGTGAGRAQLFVSRGAGRLVRRGVELPTGREVIKGKELFGGAQLGVMFIGKTKTTVSLGVGRFAPKLITQPGKTLPFADVGIAQRGARDIGVLGKTFVGRGDVIRLDPRFAVESAGLVREVSGVQKFTFIPGTRGQASLLPFARTAPTPSLPSVGLDPFRTTALLQTQSLVRAFSATAPTPQTLRTFTSLPGYGISGVLAGGSVGIRRGVLDSSFFRDFVRGRDAGRVTGLATEETRQTQAQLTVLRDFSAQRLGQRNLFLVSEREAQRFAAAPSQIFSTGTKQRFRQPLLQIPITTQTPRLKISSLLRPPSTTTRVPRFPPLVPLRFPGLPLFLTGKPGRGMGLTGNFFARYSPSLTTSTFRLFGRPSRRALRTGIVTPFERRFLINGKRKRRRNILGI